VVGGAAAIIVWEALVALVARRRPVPLIFYVIGLIAVCIVAAMLLANRAASTEALAVGSVATGFLAAIGVAIIWQLSQGTPPAAGTRTGVRVARTFVMRGLMFSVVVLLIGLILRAVRHGG